MPDRYKINLTWNHDKKIKGWSGAIYKNDGRWRLTTYHKTRKLVILKALEMILVDGAIIKSLDITCEEEI